MPTGDPETGGHNQREPLTPAPLRNPIVTFSVVAIGLLLVIAYFVIPLLQQPDYAVEILPRSLANHSMVDPELQIITGQCNPAKNSDLLAERRNAGSSDACLEFAQSLKDPSCVRPSPFRVHWYWNVLPNVDFNTFAPKAVIAIKSAIVTQPNTTEFIIWTSDVLRIRKAIGSVNHFVTVRHWDPIAEVKGTPLDGRMSEANLVRNDQYNWKAGDLMRTVALYKYGGLYVDLDVLFVRSFEPLLGEDFVYQWSCHAYWQNAAVILSTQSKGAMITSFLNELPGVQDGTDPFLWSRDIMGKLKRQGAPFLVYPPCFFDPMWVWHDNCERGEAKFGNWRLDEWWTNKKPITNTSEFFPGTFAVHWHNGWRETPASSSPFKVFATWVEERYKELASSR